MKRLIERLKNAIVEALKPARWAFVYDEENPAPYGDCTTGILSDGKRFLFFDVYEHNGIEYRSIRSNMAPIDGTEICRYPLTVTNDAILLDALDKVGDNYCGDDSPIQFLEFERYFG